MALTKTRFKKADKIAAIRRLRTETHEVIARSLDVTTHTIRNWEKLYKSSIPPEPLGVRVETVPLPKAPEKPQSESSGPTVPTPGSDGGYEAARRAALGEDVPPEEPAPEVEPVDAERIPPPQPELPPLPPEKTLLMLTELATVMSCKMYAAKLKVKWTDELKAALALTPGEKKDLETYAPYAVPLMGVMLAKYGMYIGAGIYCFIFWNALSDRFVAVKALAPKKEEKPEPPK